MYTDNGFVLQKLRHFTVQILNRISEDQYLPLGTGFVIDRGEDLGLGIVTCLHVIKKAGFDSSTFQLDDSNQTTTLRIRFSYKELRKELFGVVPVSYFRENLDDIVVLKVTDQLPKGIPRSVAIVGSAENSEGHEFRSFGYAPIGNNLQNM
jgi:hypothetical protein